MTPTPTTPEALVERLVRAAYLASNRTAAHMTPNQTPQEALVERVARAITNELSRQDGVDGEWLFEPNSLRIAFIDQGMVDMGAVARAAIPIAYEAGVIAGREEAARVAERCGMQGTPKPSDTPCSLLRRSIAAAIRAINPISQKEA